MKSAPAFRIRQSLGRFSRGVQRAAAPRPLARAFLTQLLSGLLSANNNAAEACGAAAASSDGNIGPDLSDANFGPGLDFPVANSRHAADFSDGKLVFRLDFSDANLEPGFDFKRAKGAKSA